MDARLLVLAFVAGLALVYVWDTILPRAFASAAADGREEVAELVAQVEFGGRQVAPAAVIGAVLLFASSGPQA